MTSPPRWPIPVAVLVAVAVQAGAGLIWAGKASARIDTLSAQVAGQGAVTERLARLEAQVEDVRAGVGRIERRLDR